MLDNGRLIDRLIMRTNCHSDIFNDKSFHETNVSNFVEFIFVVVEFPIREYMPGTQDKSSSIFSLSSNYLRLL